MTNLLRDVVAAARAARAAWATEWRWRRWHREQLNYREDTR